MKKKEMFDLKDKFLLPIANICLLLSSILVGNIVQNFFRLLIIILFISFVYWFIKIRKINSELWYGVKHCCYVLSISLALTIVFASVLPYLVFQNRFYSWIEIQYLYLTPVFFMFLMSAFLFNKIIRQEKPQFLHNLKVSLIVTIILSLIISAVGVGFWVVFQQSRSKWYNTAFDNNMHSIYMHSILDDTKIRPELQIYREIYNYRINHINKAYEKKIEFDEKKTSLCIRENCARTVANKALHVLEVFIETMVIKGRLTQADEELDFIYSEDFNYDSFEEYLELLEKNITIDYANVDLITPPKIVVPSDIRFEYLSEYSDVGVADLNYFDSNPDESPLWAGIKFATSHSIFYKELYRLFVKIQITTGQSSRAPSLLVYLHKNISVEEPVESKIIRYRLLSSWG